MVGGNIDIKIPPFCIVLVCFFFCCSDNSQFDLEEDQIVNYIDSQSVEYTMSSTGYYYAIIDSGTVDLPTLNSTVIITYDQYLLDDTVIESIGEDLTIDLDLLLNGVQSGLRLIGRGGVISLLLPSSQALGEIGDSRVPPNTPVRIELRLIEHYTDITDLQERQILDYIDASGLDTLNVSQVYYTVIDSGFLTPVTLTSNLTMRYRGYYLDGSVFDIEYFEGDGLTFDVSSSIEAWQSILPLFSLGGKGSIYAPSEFAFGEDGNEVVPADTPVLFDFEIISIQ